MATNSIQDLANGLAQLATDILSSDFGFVVAYTDQSQPPITNAGLVCSLGKIDANLAQELDIEETEQARTVFMPRQPITYTADRILQSNGHDISVEWIASTKVIFHYLNHGFSTNDSVQFSGAWNTLPDEMLNTPMQVLKESNDAFSVAYSVLISGQQTETSTTATIIQSSITTAGYWPVHSPRINDTITTDDGKEWQVKRWNVDSRGVMYQLDVVNDSAEYLGA